MKTWEEGEAGEHALEVEEVITIELTGDPGSTALRFPRPDWMSEAEHEAWLEHVDADLELIRTTPAGRAGLEALDDASDESDAHWLDPFVDVDRHIVVVPYGSRGGIKDDFSAEDWLGSGSGGGVGSLPGNSASPPFPTGLIDRDAEVSYGHVHSNALDDRPPAVSLYHELSHAYDQILGGTEGGDYTEILRDADGNEIARYEDTPRAEINSVGRDLDGDGDIDTRENAKGHDHPTSLTENSLREDLGWDLRDSYVYETDPGETVEIEELD